MKVLHLINSLETGGAEKLLIESIPLFSKSGSEFDVLLLNGKETPFFHKLKNLNCCAIFTLGEVSVYNPLLIFKIIPFFKKYDIIHVHLFPGLYWAAFAKIVSFSSIKLIYTEHNTYNKRRDSFFLSLVDKIAYSQYNSIVAITDKVLFNLKKHLNSKDYNKFRVIENGLNLEEIKCAQPYDKIIFFSDKEAKILIQVARFIEPKDQKTVIKSLSLLPDKFKLILVGDGNLRSECETLVNQMGLQSRVRFLGVRTDVLSLLKTSDFVILSSGYEGLSLSCIEGMASGKPFLASNVPGLKEVVDGYGLLFENSNHVKLSELIIQLAGDKNYYKQVADLCMQKATQYDINNMVNDYLEAYESL